MGSAKDNPSGICRGCGSTASKKSANRYKATCGALLCVNKVKSLAGKNAKQHSPWKNE